MRPHRTSRPNRRGDQSTRPTILRPRHGNDNGNKKYISKERKPTVQPNRRHRRLQPRITKTQTYRRQLWNTITHRRMGTRHRHRNRPNPTNTPRHRRRHHRDSPSLTTNANLVRGRHRYVRRQATRDLRNVRGNGFGKRKWDLPTYYSYPCNGVRPNERWRRNLCGKWAGLGPTRGVSRAKRG